MISETVARTDELSGSYHLAQLYEMFQGLLHHCFVFLFFLMIFLFWFGFTALISVIFGNSRQLFAAEKGLKKKPTVLYLLGTKKQ